jgi:hypothetical protein
MRILKYKVLKNGFISITSVCKEFQHIRIGSVGCMLCKYFDSRNKKNFTVHCNYPHNAKKKWAEK